MIFVQGDDTMTLKEFTDMAHSCNSPYNRNTVQWYRVRGGVPSNQERRIGFVKIPIYIPDSGSPDKQIRKCQGGGFLQGMPSSRKYIEKEYIYTGYRDTDVVDYLI